MGLRLRVALIGLAAAILLLGATRLGDLAGYDDALFALEAKGIVRTGAWLTPSCRGAPALEHPPLFVWTQAAFLSVFGVSDPVAKLPSALCGLGTVLLVFWLARRLLRDSLAASAAMFIMLATPYFLKYAGRAMTDVPATFLFAAAVCAGLLAEENPRWYLGAGALTAAALMVRGLIGVALPVIFALHLLAARKRPPWRYIIPALAIAIVPIAAWYVYLLERWGGYFISAHEGWLQREVYGGFASPWRRYTGLPEYVWMLAKSYWPWLPVLGLGVVAVIRDRARSLYLLLGWAGTVLLLCAAAHSRVLRYMLPAYPAFAILSAIGLVRYLRRERVERALNWAAAFSVPAALGVVLLWPAHPHATEILEVARQNNRALPPAAAVGFYDKGDPRYDEANQLEWYGENPPLFLQTREQIEHALQAGAPRVFVLDQAAYRALIEPRPHQVIAEAGHLVSVRLTNRQTP